MSKFCVVYFILKRRDKVKNATVVQNHLTSNMTEKKEKAKPNQT